MFKSGSDGRQHQRQDHAGRVFAEDRDPVWQIRADLADRSGIRPRETLATRRQAQPPIYYVVGTPKGRLSQLEQAFMSKPWEPVRESVTVRKLLPHDGELYLLAKSTYRAAKERIRLSGNLRC